MSQAGSARSLRLVWTAQASRDLDDIAEFIAQDNPAAAVQWVEQLVVTAERLPRSPRIGRKVPELCRDDVRELIQARYRVVYRISDGLIEVLTVFEGHRLLRCDDI